MRAETRLIRWQFLRSIRRSKRPKSPTKYLAQAQARHGETVEME